MNKVISRNKKNVVVEVVENVVEVVVKISGANKTKVV